MTLRRLLCQQYVNSPATQNVGSSSVFLQTKSISVDIRQDDVRRQTGDVVQNFISLDNSEERPSHVGVTGGGEIGEAVIKTSTIYALIQDRDMS